MVAIGDNQQPRSKAEIDHIKDTIEENRARIQHACLEAKAAVNKVEDEKRKIKAAFIW